MFFKAHIIEVLLETPKKETIKVVYVPASCTDKDKGKIKTVPINPLMADVMAEHSKLNFQYFSTSAKAIYTRG